MHKPAELREPTPEYVETDGGRYKIEAITAGSLARFNAGKYAKAIHQLRADAWQVAPWAVRSEPDDERRRILIAKDFNPLDDKLVDATGHRIANIGRSILTIGLFDVTTDSPLGHPTTLRGFVQPNLEVSGSTFDVWRKRHSTPEKVYPSLGGGPEISIDVPLKDREHLYDRLFRVALGAFDPDDIGITYRSTLDTYLTEHDYETMVRLSHLGALKISNGVAERKYVSSKLARMQFPDLTALRAKASDIL